MSEEAVLIIKEGYTATVTINRRASLNAVDMETLKLLLNIFERAVSDEGVRVIILEGAGDNFSVGADMSFLDHAMDLSQWYDFLKNVVSKLILAIRMAPQPVICKVRGNAYGFGVGLALAGDFVIASEDARFCEVFVNVGVTLDGGQAISCPVLLAWPKRENLPFSEVSLLGKMRPLWDSSIVLYQKKLSMKKLPR